MSTLFSLLDNYLFQKVYGYYYYSVMEELLKKTKHIRKTIGNNYTIDRFHPMNHIQHQREEYSSKPLRSAVYSTMNSPIYRTNGIISLYGFFIERLSKGKPITWHKPCKAFDLIYYSLFGHHIEEYFNCFYTPYRNAKLIGELNSYYHICNNASAVAEGREPEQNLVIETDKFKIVCLILKHVSGFPSQHFFEITSTLIEYQ